MRESKRDDLTPESGTDLTDLQALSRMTTSEYLLYLANQVREVREQLQRTQIAATKACAASHMAERHADANREGIRVLREDVESLKLAVLGELIPVARRSRERLDALEDKIGSPPHTIDIGRASLVKDHSAAELTAMERDGTGLYAVVSRLIAGQSRMSKRVAIGAGVSAAAAPVIIELVKTLIGGH